MCYSFNTSLFSYLCGLSASIFALSTRQIILGMFILFYSQIQLGETIIWKGIDTNNIELNKKGTLFLKYSLPTHLFAIGLGYLIINKSNLQPKHFTMITIGILFYFYVLFLYSMNKSEQITYTKDATCKDRSCQNNNNRLLWPFPNTWYFISFIIILIFTIIYIKPFETQLLLGFFYSIMYIFSKYLYYKTGESSSFWCFSAAILSPIIVALNYYLIRTKTNIIS